GVTEGDPAGSIAGRDLAQLLGQGNESLVVKIGAGHMDQACGLILDCAHHVRMAVAGSYDRDTGIEVQKAVAIDVFYNGALPFGRDQWIAARVRGRNNTTIPLDNSERARTRHRAG